MKCVRAFQRLRGKRNRITGASETHRAIAGQAARSFLRVFRSAIRSKRMSQAARAAAPTTYGAPAEISDHGLLRIVEELE